MTKFVKTFISAAAILTLALTLLSTPFQHAQAAGPFTVTTTADTNDASINGVCADAGGQCSLRAAIEEANQSGSPTTINVPAGTYNLVLGELSIAPNGNRTITINGAGAASTIINQTDGQNRVFNIDFFAFGATYVTINAVTISGGSDRIDSLGGAGILAGSFSSLPRDSLTLTNCIVTNNHVYQPDPTYTSQPGGGLQMAGGDLTITNCTFSNNSSAASNGGGVAYIAPDQGGTVIITGSTFSGNSVVNNTTSGPVGGGALFLTSSLSSPNTTTISNSTFNNNTVTSISSGTVYGGAILHNTGVLSIDHSVFTANAVGGAGGQGGAIYVDSGTLNLSYSRLSGNSASNGGSGLYNHSSNGAISNAANNWWGCPTGPAASPCDLAAANGANLTYTPWITLTHTASPDPIFVNQSTTLTASFLKNSAGATLTTDQVSVLLGLPVTWSNPVLGTLSAQQTTIQANGQATAAFTAGAVGGTGHADATVDHGPATASFTITPYADLAVTKSALPSVVAGENLAYTITITNNGPSAAANTVLSDTLPAGTTFFSQSQTAGSSSFTLSNTGNTISNTLASFPAGDSATFMVVVQVSAAQANGSTISNTATATSSTYEPDASDNTSTATTSVTTSADLALTKTSPATVIPGASVTYTLTLVNNGPSDAQGVSLADTLPTGLTFVSQEQTSGPAFTLTNPGNGIQNTIATLPVGASATFNVVASAGASLTGGTTLVNSASASSSTSDPDPANNSDSTTITVNIPPAITSANNVTFTVGMAGSFTVTATGYPTPALSQTGSLPSGVTFVDNGNGTATLSGTPATGTSGTYALTLTAANGVGSNATQSFTLNVADGLAITSPANTTFTIGQAGSFTVTTSGVPTPTLSLTGTLPSGVSFVDNGNGTATQIGRAHV